MSPDESDLGVNNTARSQPEESSDSSDDNLQSGSQRKKLIRYQLP